MITETDDVAAAVDDAAALRPGEPRSVLLRRLVGDGDDRLAAAARERGLRVR
ncbi:hypothetical protein [Patulibacter sp.]|uniref:hypothetical protein n=1 Tax=Patulibacter sp. TaxID=1912859 RepID=UPI002720DCD9|nr:hypothetical protein [Patulibacter sp.]MDO9410442.1 hypothetical protein [Patulibacter sp.]